MKKALKRILPGAFACVIAAVVALAVTLTGGAPEALRGLLYPSSVRTVSDGASGYTLSVDESNLHFVVTHTDGDGNITGEWQSGERPFERDESGNIKTDADGNPIPETDADGNPADGLNEVLGRRVTDGVTVGYIAGANNIANERALTDARVGGRVTSLAEIANGFRARVELASLGISFTVEFTLGGGYLDVSVPFGGITETNANYRLSSISVAPFMRAVRGGEPGFILLPDGNGAVIDTSRATSAKSAYSARVYGADLGIIGATAPSTQYPVVMPVYGVSRDGEGGILACVARGAEYSEIGASAAGMTGDYNFAYSKFIYREQYVRYLDAAGKKTYNDVQSDKNEFDAKIRFYLLEDGGASLSDMADAYRSYLTAEELLGAPRTSGGTAASGNTPLRVQFLMADNKEAMFGRQTVTVTTADFLRKTAVPDLSAASGNLNISLLGYRSGGLTGSYPRHFGVEGGAGAYRELGAELKAGGNSLSYATDYLRGFLDGFAGGFGEGDKAMSIGERYVRSADLKTGWQYQNLTINGFNKTIKAEANARKDMKVEAVDFESMGYALYGSYRNQKFSRSDMAAALGEAARGFGTRVNMERPNQYMWRYCDAYLSAPSGSSGLLIATESVPFMSMALSGYMNMFSGAVNLDWRGDDALALIDYNVYPAFALTERDSIELIGGASGANYLFSSRYSVWKDRVIKLYNEVDSVLGAVVGRRITERAKLAAGVYKNTYENGLATVVNYGRADYVTDTGVTVKARGAALTAA